MRRTTLRGVSRARPSPGEPNLTRWTLAASSLSPVLALKSALHRRGASPRHTRKEVEGASVVPSFDRNHPS